MYGNLLNNKQILWTIKNHVIEISDFEDDNLGVAHYTLRVRRALRLEDDKKWVQAWNIEEDENPFFLRDNEYVLVEPLERITLKSEGIVGNFVPASNLIERGLGLVCGKIDKKYGTSGETIRFGLKNLRSSTTEIRPRERIAHVQFYDLRSLASLPQKLSNEEQKIRLKRALKAMDDGVDYD